MLVILSGTGDTVNTLLHTPVRIFAGGPYDTPITTNPVTFGGVKTGGSYQYENANAGKCSVGWYLTPNTPFKTWQLDSVAAFDTLKATIATAEAANDPVIYVTTAGTLGAS